MLRYEMGRIVVTKKRTGSAKSKHDKVAHSSVRCKDCGADLEGWGDGPTRNPCPNCGSTSRLYDATGQVTARAEVTADVQHLSPISPMVLNLAELHCREAERGDPEKRATHEHVLAVVIMSTIYANSALYETLVDARKLTHSEYVKQAGQINWCRKGPLTKKKLRDEIANTHPKVVPPDRDGDPDPGRISTTELHWYHFTKTVLSRDFYSEWNKEWKTYRELVNLRNALEHYEQFEVEDQLEHPRRKLTPVNGRLYLDIVKAMVQRLDSYT